MQKLGIGGAAHKAGFTGVIAVLLLAGAHTASAQTSTPTANNPVDNAPSEAARRAAASPYRFILQNATAPRKAAAPAPAPAPAAAVATEARRQPAPAPVQQAAAHPSAPQAPARAEPAPAPAMQAAPPPVAEPAVAALTRKPAELPPARREIIPIQTDEPKLSPALLREQPKGVVKVHFDIQPNGTVSEVKVLASTNRSLNRPTVEAIQGWKFQPVDEILTVETEVVYKFD